MESRATYGYYGEGHGATGENPPKEYRGGWQYNYFVFRVDWHDPMFSQRVEIKAKSYKNALRAVKAWAKRDGGTFLGDYE